MTGVIIGVTMVLLYAIKVLRSLLEASLGPPSRSACLHPAART